MPEGHTIHRIARDHSEWLGQQRLIVQSPQGRFSEGAQRLSGKVLRSVSAHGKHLFYHWNQRLITHVHLGLYGKFRSHSNPAPPPRGAVRMRLIGNRTAVDLNGPTCCEIIDRAGFQKIKRRLGEDPLRDDADVEVVWEKICKTRSPIGRVLLDQSVIAGVGNVYRAEILFLMGMHPEKPANEIDRLGFEEMWMMTVDLLKVGVEQNRIITAGLTKNRKVGRRRVVERLNIYKRSQCLVCGSAVKKWKLGQRTIYACGKCQTL